MHRSILSAASPLVSIFILLLFLSSGRSDDPGSPAEDLPPKGDLPPKIAALVESIKSRNAGQIAGMELQIKNLQNTLRTRGRDLSRAEKAKIADSIATLKLLIPEFKAGRAVTFPDLDPVNLKVGGIGCLREIKGAMKFSVAQVIDDKTMVIVPTKTKFRVRPGDAAGQTFYKEDGQRFIIRGLPTEGLADDSKFSTAKVFEVTGTESHQTVIGAKATIFVLEPLEVDKWMEEIKARVAGKAGGE